MNYLNLTSFFILPSFSQQSKEGDVISAQTELSSGLKLKLTVKIILFICVIWLLAGCSGFASKQDPAPVYGKADTPGKKTKAAVDRDSEQTAQIKVVQDPVILKQQELAVKSQSKSSTVVVALLTEADVSYKQGNLDESVSTIERALHIEPRNPLLLYKLASLRLQQGLPDLAENLAKKSALLAEGNASLKKQNWLLIATAREQMGDLAGAEAARKKAGRF